MLLFPTFWKGEGMPGTIIDALGAALPIIARRWDYCDEILEDGKNAWVYDFDQPQQLVDKIDYAISHPSEVMEMKNACLHAALRYSEGHVMKKILQLLEQE
jgi:glycosyltransferase involved in cell wall biosynthesis